jgi:putative peptidoglycan lipid II flippase
MSGLGRSTRAMAVGTIASRGTGLLRNVVLAAVLGVETVGVAFTVANTAPNIVYELLLGGVLTSVVVPLLVRAAKEDGDQGQAYAQRLLTLVVLVLGGASVLLVLLAPWIVDLYADDLSPEGRELATVFARYFLPQVLFYGIGAVLGAVLNTRGRYAPPMWAPVLNNLVVIATGLAFLPCADAARADPGEPHPRAAGACSGSAPRSASWRRPSRCSRRCARPASRCARAGTSASSGCAGSARWPVGAAVRRRQPAGLPGRGEPRDRRRAGGGGRGYPSYVYAFLLFSLPHAVVAVSVITALLPRMSRAAADGRTGDLRTSLNRGLRLTAAVLVPAAVAFVALGRELAVLVFARGQVSVADARYVGVLLGVFALGLVPFSCYQLQLRAFYAMQDTRTPTLINLAVNATLVGVGSLLYVLLPDRYEVAGLAAGHACSFLAGLAVCSVVLSRRLGGLDLSLVVRTVVRCLLAAAGPGLLAAGLAELVGRELGRGPLGAAVSLALGGAVLAVGYVLATRRLRVPEVAEVAGPVLRRVGLG